MDLEYRQTGYLSSIIPRLVIPHKFFTAFCEIGIEFNIFVKIH